VPPVGSLIVIGEVHYNGALAYTPVPPYSTPTISEAGFKTLSTTATSATPATQSFAMLTPESGPTAYYSAFGYVLEPSGSAINTTYDSGGGGPNFSTSSITVTLTTTVPNCLGIIFIFNDGTNGPLASTIATNPAMGWSSEMGAPYVNAANSGMVTWYSSNPLPVGTTTVTVPNLTRVNMLVEGVAVSP
jgi:hypothetical protein